MLADMGMQITELSTHLQGQLVAVHPAYDTLFDAFAPKEVRGNPKARQEWAVEQVDARREGFAPPGPRCERDVLRLAAPGPTSSLGHSARRAFSKPRSKSSAKRWLPILNALRGCRRRLCYEIHPSEDLFDGTTFEMFLDRVKGHKRCNILFDPSHFCLQQLNYLEYIDLYHERIKMFHVKDAEFNPTGTSGRLLWLCAMA